MKHYRQQQGMTLVVSLIILISLTIIGLTSMQSTNTEISMAGNLRESALTFQAAEVGLADGEGFTEDSISKNVFTDPDNGLLDTTDADPDYFADATWNASQTGSTVVSHTAQRPTFIVRYLGDRAQNPAALINIGGYGSGQPGMIVSNFRVTSRGEGQTGSFYRYLQSYYGKEF